MILRAGAPRPSSVLRRRRGGRHGPFGTLLAGWAVLVALFLLAPLLIVVIDSLGREQYVVFPPAGYSLTWYAQIPQYYVDGAILSIEVAVAAVITASFLAVPAGLAIARGSLPGKALVDAFLRSPVQVPLLISGVAFLQFYVLIQRSGGPDVTGTFIALWVAHTIVVAPYILVAVVARLARYPDSLDEAAYGLGATPVRAFFDVTLPIISPAVASGLFFAFLVSFDNVPTTIFLVGANQNTLPLALFFDTEFALSRIQYAVGTVVTIVSTVVILLAMRKLDLLPSVQSAKAGGG